MKALIEIECKNPERVIKSIEPDMENNGKFDVKLEEHDGKIFLKIEAPEISGVLAALNSYLRLIKTAMEVDDIA